jgi:hypothetical protein
MDSIKKKLSKIKFDSIIKFFIITLIVLSIFLLIRYLLNKKKIELFNVDQDDCKDKYLLNYGDKSISSILIDKDIRYGFFNDIKKVKNNYYDTLVSVKDNNNVSISSLKLFIIDSFENPVIITPAEFKFINNDKKYPVLTGGYDFNNVIFLLKINNFTGSSNQDYATIFDNSIFELRLITKNTNSNKKLFNLLLINKFSKDNNGFMLDPEITNIELNKYYYIRISVIDGIPNYSNDVCLTLIEVEKNIYGDTLYQKANTFENSKIQNILIDPSNNSGGILKCENTAIGRKVSQLELSGDVPSLNMDFGFVKIGGGSKVNISMMPKPPTTTTTTIEQSISNVNRVKLPEDTENQNIVLKAAINFLYTITNFNNINTTDNFSNTQQNINIEHFSNDESSVNLSGILNFLNGKIKHHKNNINNHTFTPIELISLFHVNYLILIRDDIKNLIEDQKSSNGSNCSDTNCDISKYSLNDEINDKLKNILTDYIDKTFNTKKNGSNNDFIKAIITDEELYNSEPQQMQNEINDLINNLIKDYNLNIDFNIKLQLYDGGEREENTRQ